MTRPSTPMEQVKEALGHLAGHASMCWNPRPSTQVFDSSEASIAVDKAMFFIAAAIQQAVEDERETCANIATNYPDLARSSVGLAAAVMCEVSDDIATAIRARGAKKEDEGSG